MAAGDTGSFSVVSVDEIHQNEQRIAELEAKSLADAQRIAELEAKSLADAQRITEFEFAIKAWERWKEGKSEALEAWRHWAHQRLYFGGTPTPPDSDDVLMRKLAELWKLQLDSEKSERAPLVGRLREWRDWVLRLGSPALSTDEELMQWVVGKWQRLEASAAESAAYQNTLRRERDEARNTWFEKREPLTAGEKEALASAGRYQANSLEEWRKWAKKYAGQEGGDLFDTELRAAIEHRFLASIAELKKGARLQEWLEWAHKFTVRLGTQASRVHAGTLDTELREAIDEWSNASRVHAGTLDTELREVIDEWSNRAREEHADALSRIAELERLPKTYEPKLQEILFDAWTQRDKAQNELISKQAELDTGRHAIDGLVEEASRSAQALQEWREWASGVGGNGTFSGEADSWLRVRVEDQANRVHIWRAWAQRQAGGKLEVGETDSGLQARVVEVLHKPPQKEMVRAWMDEAMLEWMERAKTKMPDVALSMFDEKQLVAELYRRRS